MTDGSSPGYTEASVSWTLVCGTWKTTDESVLREVRQAVRDLLTSGSGIITGGALGVDLAAAEESLRRFPDGSRLRIVIPTPFRKYCEHYRQRAEEGVITDLLAEELITVLEALRKVAPDNLYELAHTTVDKTAYWDRIRECVTMADSVLAFSVGGSAGTAETIAQAHVRKLPVTVREYSPRT